ncbi:MAG: rod shape-determining protein MreD [Acidimicrobiia bacterium]
MHLSETALRRIRLGLVVFLVVLLQTTLFSSLRLFGVAADVGLVVTVAVGYREGPEAGVIFGFAAGFTMDMFLQTPIGISALTYALTGYGAGLVQMGLARSAWWVRPALGALGGLFGGALFILIATVVGEDDLLTLYGLRVVLLSAAYDALLAPVLFPIANWAVGEKTRRRPGAGLPTRRSGGDTVARPPSPAPMRQHGVP